MTPAPDPRRFAELSAEADQVRGLERSPEAFISVERHAVRRSDGTGLQERDQAAANVGVGVGEYRLRAPAPDDIFSLAVEADEATARAEHAGFADRCMPLLAAGPGEPGQIRRALLEQLWAARQIVTGGGIGYLGALAGELDGRTPLILLGIAAAPFEVPEGVRPTSLLAALLRHHYPGAQVEEFSTAHGEGVGIRRSDELPLPSRVPDGEPLTIDTGISQALVPFPEAGLLGTVTGFCFSPADIDVATVFTATIAHRMTVVRGVGRSAPAAVTATSRGPRLPGTATPGRAGH